MRKSRIVQVRIFFNQQINKYMEMRSLLRHIEGVLGRSRGMPGSRKWNTEVLIFAAINVKCGIRGG